MEEEEEEEEVVDEGAAVVEAEALGRLWMEAKGRKLPSGGASCSSMAARGFGWVFVDWAPRRAELGEGRR